jgi:hypothetical protein
MVNKTDYYIDPKRKIRDFCLGLFGSWGVVIIYYVIALTLSSSLSSMVWRFAMSFTLTLLIIIIIQIILIVVFFRKGRRFIGIGILMAILIPIILTLLFFGACLIGLMRY